MLSGLWSNPLFCFFLVVSLGLALGRVRIGGLSLEAAGVLFAGLLLGHLGGAVPQVFLPWGQVLFIFAIGMQSGPELIAAFRRHGWWMMGVAVPVILSGAAVTVGFARWLGLDWSLAAGLFAGGLTSTPGLAAAIEASGSPLASIGYGAAYPIGVLSVIVFVRLAPRLFGWNLKQAETDYLHESHEQYPRLKHRTYIVQNPSLLKKTLGALNFTEMTGATISRIRQGELSVASSPDIQLALGDLVMAVGSEEALEKVRLLVGPQTRREITFSHTYCAKWILVSNRKIVNRSLAELHLLPENRITITRIRRSGVDIQPGPTDRLRLGDRLRVVCHTDQLDWVIRTLGNAVAQLVETDLLPVFLGLTLGVCLGQIPIPLPGLPPFKLGLTGGVLVSSLFLSRRVRTGPVVWSLSPQTHLFLREMGLVGFLAVVGTQAGAQISGILAENGITLLVAALGIALVPMVVGACVGRWIFKMNPLTLLGVLTGAMTSTPGLAAAQGSSQSSAPSVAYATIYPLAMVGVVILTRLLVGLGGG